MKVPCHQKFVPKRLYALATGLYTCIKSLKMCIKSDCEEIILNIWAKRKGLSVVIKFFVPNALPAPAWGYIHMKKKHIKNGKKSDFKEIFFKLATNGQSDKEFLLTSTFCPQGVVCPCPGAIYMYKII